MLKPSGTPSGKGQDLVAEHGVADSPGAPGGIGPFFQLHGDANGQGAGVAGMGGGEGHPARVGAGQGASLKGLGDKPAPVEHLSGDAPGK